MVTSTQTYRSMDGRHWFVFVLKFTGRHIEPHCTRHPSLAGRDPSPSRTHLFSSGALCFQPGHEPRTVHEARQRCKEWAEYLIRYIRTGETES